MRGQVQSDIDKVGRNVFDFYRLSRKEFEAKQILLRQKG